ncbi:MAG: hypothetical protein KF861_16035 [Planctomycetaceae bacterium]|nr:hypothetical protein [Planctomycetaceae bacterium]
MTRPPARELSLLISFLAAVASPHTGRAFAEPQVLIPGLVLELVATEPDIVTPIGLTFDHRGRLLVTESHTHFPADGYAGPKFDRIRILEDLDGDGRADHFANFLEGPEKTMSLRRGPGDWIYVATRMQVFRVRDADGDGIADERESIATLDTEGDYPHNGLSGLCFDESGALYFGLGENLGASYTLTGSDGARFVGGGEGGNIYRCAADGTGLTQVATGFWNPFGICTDSSGRIYTVGNDPDASPPCRLLHVVNGGDYGYQFRYGRSGKHPLQAWDGELPGTLPMAAGTGEAPSGVVQWHGQLYATSWGEHRIERFTLKPHGASVLADREVVVQGDGQFRPVDLAIAPDGSLYFTDWVDQSYNVHGKGRVWRLRWDQPPPDVAVPPLSDDEQRAQRSSRTLDWEAVRSEDPFLHHAAMTALIGSPLLTADVLSARDVARERLAILEAARRSTILPQTRDALLAAALQDRDPSVRLFAVRWIADQRLTAFRSALESLLMDDSLSASHFQAVIAAIEWLDSGNVERGRVPGEAALLAALDDTARPHLQAMAIKTLPADHAVLTAERLAEFIRQASDPQVQIEAARTLAIRSTPDVTEVRAALADDAQIAPALREIVRAGIAPAESSPPGSATSVSTSPQPVDVAAWAALLDGPASAERGWLVFFGQGKVRCASCHRLDVRGADVGPDLTGIGRRMDRERLLESILTPSREVAPRYVPWAVVTQDGRVFNGLSLGVVNGGLDERFLTADGKTFDVPIAEIESRKLSTQSIMPDGLHQLLSIEELRDLLALLSE